MPAPAKAEPQSLSRPLKAGDHVFLVDGSGYIFRAYHALPPLSRKSDGLQVNAVLGFCNMLWKLLRDMKPAERPTHLAVVFDKSEVTFRNKLYGEYKANRSAPPDDLIPQFPLIREAVAAFDIPCLEQGGFEADDLIATYTRLACEAGAITTIVSSDKDLMQLVSDCVTLYDTMKDKRLGPADVIEKFGVPPDKMIDVQALIGDSVDNVPGVPGIGVKTAAQLILEYGDLDTLLSRAGEIKQQKRRETLLTHIEQAQLSRILVTLDQHVALDVPVDDLAVHEPDYRRLIAFLKAMEFTTLTRRVADSGDFDAAAIEPDARLVAGEVAITSPPPDGRPNAFPTPDGAGAADAAPRGADGEALPAPGIAAAQRLATIRAMPLDRASYQVLRTRAALDAFIARAFERGIVALDVKPTMADPMQAKPCGIGLALSPNDAAYVPIGHRDAKSEPGTDLFSPAAALVEGQLAEAEVLAALQPLLESHAVLKVGHNVKPAVLLLARLNIVAAPFDDVMLMSYVLDAGNGGHGIDELSRKWLGHEPVAFHSVVGTGKAQIAFDAVPIEKAGAFAAEDSDVTLRLWQALRARLPAERVRTVYATLERPLVAVLGRMERRGIAIDRRTLARLSGEFAQKQTAIEAEINTLAGAPVNPGSPKQLGDILFGQMGLPGGTKTKTGQWATGARALEDLAEQGHEFPRKILDWRQVSKLRSTYTDALPAYVNAETQRVHTSYALAATSTGRLSSSEPNLQNIPIRTEEGRKIRRAFVAVPGTKLVSADYSQIELRLLAEIADIPVLKQAFRDGQDIHAMTASEMFGVPIEGMPGEVRRRAKAINFGIIYGISAFGLAAQLSIGREEAGAYIKRYFERFPGIRDYMDETKAFCRANGYVVTLFGRKAHYPDIRASNPSVRAFNERAAVNARLQGSAADIIRRAMVRIEPELEAAGLAAQMLLQVHDELIFEVPDAEVAATLPVVKRVMENATMPAVSLSVPLQVDARAAGNWDEAH